MKTKIQLIEALENIKNFLLFNESFSAHDLEIFRRVENIIAKKSPIKYKIPTEIRIFFYYFTR